MQIEISVTTNFFKIRISCSGTIKRREILQVVGSRL